MDLSIQTTAYVGNRPNPWASSHGLDNARSVTIITSNLAAGDLVGDAVPGYLPAGFPLGEITADSTFAKYVDGNVDGTETLVGLCGSDIWVESLSTRVTVPLVEHAFVTEANLPETIDAAGKTDVSGRIIFR